MRHSLRLSTLGIGDDRHHLVHVAVAQGCIDARYCHRMWGNKSPSRLDLLSNHNLAQAAGHAGGCLRRQRSIRSRAWSNRDIPGSGPEQLVLVRRSVCFCRATPQIGFSPPAHGEVRFAPKQILKCGRYGRSAALRNRLVVALLRRTVSEIDAEILDCRNQFAKA